MEIKKNHPTKKTKCKDTKKIEYLENSGIPLKRETLTANFPNEKDCSICLDSDNGKIVKTKTTLYTFSKNTISNESQTPESAKAKSSCDSRRAISEYCLSAHTSLRVQCLLSNKILKNGVLKKQLRT